MNYRSLTAVALLVFFIILFVLYLSPTHSVDQNMPSEVGAGVASDEQVVHPEGDSVASKAEGAKDETPTSTGFATANLETLPVGEEGRDARFFGVVVLAGNEQPVSGARVYLERRDSRRPMIAVTDEDGAFSFKDLDAGTYFFHGDAPGLTSRRSANLARFTLDQETPSRGPETIVLYEALPMGFEVRDAQTGRPVPGAELRVNRNQLPVATTDDKGFAQVKMPPGFWSVFTKAAGYAQQEGSFSNHGAQQPLFQIQLEPGSQVGGTVFGSTGEPLPGASVRVRGQNVTDARSDASGRYLITGLAFGKTYSITASAKGHDYQHITLETEDGAAWERDFRLRKSTVVEVDIIGRVTNEEHEPVEGVVILDQKETQLATTDKQGRWFLEKYPMKAHEALKIILRHPDYAVTQAWVPRLKNAHQQTLESTVRLSRPRALRGSVTDEEGVPIEGAFVRVRGKWGTLQGLGTETDRDGNYALEGLHEGASISASKMGYSPKTQQLSRSMTTLDFELYSSKSMSGRVFDEEDGSPVTRFAIKFRDADRNGRYDGRFFPRMIQFHSEDGSFLFPKMRPVPRDFLVEAEGYAPALFANLDVRERHELHLKRNAAMFRGQVLDSEGTPRSGVSVVFVSISPEFTPDGVKLANPASMRGFVRVDYRTTDAAGVFTAPLLKDQDVILAVLGEGIARYDKRFNAAELLQDQLHTLRVRREAVVEVLLNMEVEKETSLSVYHRRIGSQATRVVGPGANQRFEFRNLNPGSSIVTFSLGNKQRMVKDVLLEEGQIHQVVFGEEETYAISALVLEAGEVVAPGTTVTLVPSGSVDLGQLSTGWVPAVVDNQGKAHWENIPEGNYAAELTRAQHVSSAGRKSRQLELQVYSDVETVLNFPGNTLVYGTFTGERPKSAFLWGPQRIPARIDGNRFFFDRVPLGQFYMKVVLEDREKVVRAFEIAEHAGEIDLGDIDLSGSAALRLILEGDADWGSIRAEVYTGDSLLSGFQDPYASGRVDFYLNQSRSSEKRVEGLKPGPARILLGNFSDCLLPVPEFADVELVDGGELTVRFRLESVTGFYLQLSDVTDPLVAAELENATGEIQTLAHINNYPNYRDPSRIPVFYNLGAMGLGLPEGQWTLRVETKSGRIWEKQMQLKKGVPFRLMMEKAK